MPDTPRTPSLAAVAELFGDRLEARQVAAVDAAVASGASWDELAQVMSKNGRGNAYRWRQRRQPPMTRR